MQIVIQCLIGWDLKTKQGQRGIFGVPVAVGSADEEQGRKTVHGHMTIWIKDFNRLCTFIFHKKDNYAPKLFIVKFRITVVMQTWKIQETKN